MNSIDIFNFADLAIRLELVILSLLISNLLIKIDSDVIRSRIYVSFGKLKGYFFLLSIGFLIWFTASLFVINDANEMLIDSLLFIFQLCILIFLYHLYLAIRVPEKHIL